VVKHGTLKDHGGASLRSKERPQHGTLTLLTPEGVPPRE